MLPVSQADGGKRWQRANINDLSKRAWLSWICRAGSGQVRGVGGGERTPTPGVGGHRARWHRARQYPGIPAKPIYNPPHPAHVPMFVNLAACVELSKKTWTARTAARKCGLLTSRKHHDRKTLPWLHRIKPPIGGWFTNGYLAVWTGETRENSPRCELCGETTCCTITLSLRNRWPDRLTLGNTDRSPTGHWLSGRIY